MQNDKSLQQLTREYETNMPPEIMALIRAFDWKKEVRTIVNQNQLMIDTGADLEESIYLLILGVIKVQDLYQRLIDVHEIPEDKTRKIIEEIELLIFKPLHERLMKIEDEDITTSSGDIKETHSREAILAEIEKEPEPIIKLNLYTDVDSEQKSQNQTAPISAQPILSTSSKSDAGIVKPFSISSTQTVVPSNPPIESGEIIKDTTAKPVETILQKPTITVNPEQKPKGYVADPYREPIE
jgi:hypothetical protein